MNDFEELSQRIRNDPDDLDAMKTLFVSVDDPGKKKDCQEQIDRILAKRQSLIICPKCRVGMKVYFAEPLHDKRAKCPYCGTETDIPDSFTAVKIERQTGFRNILPETEVMVYERRLDGGNQITGITSDEIQRIISEKGLAAARQELNARGIKDVTIDPLPDIAGSNDINKIIEDQGTDALKSKGVIFLGPKQLIRSILWFQFIMIAIFFYFYAHGWPRISSRSAPFLSKVGLLHQGIKSP